jgi:hypothetical protein
VGEVLGLEGHQEGDKKKKKGFGSGNALAVLASTVIYITA